MSDALVRKVTDTKVIAVVFYEENDVEDSVPNFVSLNRKAILRKNFATDDDFIDDVARAIY